MSATHLEPDEIAALGFEAVGKHVLISRRASFHGASRVRIGDHVRIDDFCLISAGEGGIQFGSYIHLAAYSSIIGAGPVTIEDFANISSRVSIYSSSDDYSGASMTNPMVPDEFKNVDRRPVRIGRHAIIGSGSVVLPGVSLEEGAAVGALSLVREDCRTFTIYAGNPAGAVGERRRDLLELERKFRSTPR
jgi:acetyltransferase-like isoleucine patch superfamily enzyme